MRQDLKMNNQNHLLKQFYRNCSIGCQADIWHYYTSLEPPYPKLQIRDNGFSLPPDEYRGQGNLCFLKMTPYGRVISEKVKIYSFLQLLFPMKQPLFVEICGSKSSVQVSCVFRKSDETVVDQALYHAFPECEYEMKGEDPFETLLKDFYKNGHCDYEFDILNLIPTMPSPSLILSKTDECQFWSNVLQSIFYELEDREFLLVQMAFIPCKHNWGTLFADTIRMAKQSIRKNEAMPYIINSLNEKLNSLSEKKMANERYFAVVFRHAFIMKSDHITRIKKMLNQSYTLLRFPYRTIDIQYLKASGLSNNEIINAVSKRLFLFPGFIVPIERLSSMLPFADNGFTEKIILINLNKNYDVCKNTNEVPRILGISRSGHREEKVFMPTELNNRHSYYLGSTGTGKTSLIENLVIQDINAGRGLCLIDPHGDLSKHILQLVPNHRIHDVVYFNPADPVYAFRFNFLELELPKYETNNAIMDACKTIFTSWSPRQYDIMQYCLLTLLDNEGTTFKDITRLLLRPEFREKMLQSVQDDNVREWWQSFARFSKDAANPISYKVNTFSTMPLISQVINQPVNCLNIFDIIDEGKILIAHLPKGPLGDEASRLLGTLLVSLIRIAALKRERLPISERKEFSLYIDEFHSFVTDSIGILLEEARKYNIAIYLAHQSFIDSNLPRSLKGAIMGNTLTKVIFRCGIRDTEFLSAEFPGIRAGDIINLPQYHAYVRMGEQVLLVRTLPPPSTSEDFSNEIIRYNHEQYYYIRPNNGKINEDFEQSHFIPNYDEI